MTKSKTVKVDPEIVRARNRARSHFRREAKTYEERSMAEAREALFRASNWADTKAYREQRTRSESIVRWITAQSQAVFASLDIKPRMEVSTVARADRPVAQGATDFQTIKVTINSSTYNEDKPADVARLIALTKGVIYHEGGHILYTVPVIDLIERAREAGFDKTFRQNGETIESNPGVVSIHEFRWVWNLLEDQRMECAVVRMSPIIERYLQVVVLDLIIKSAESAPYRAWPFITGRSYLPKNILSQYRRVAVEYAHDNDKVEILREVDRLVREYKRAKTEREMAEIVYEAVPVFEQWLGGMSGEGQVDDHTGNRSNESQPNPSDSATDSDEWGDPGMPTKGRQPSKSQKNDADSSSDPGNEVSEGDSGDDSEGFDDSEHPLWNDPSDQDLNSIPVEDSDDDDAGTGTEGDSDTESDDTHSGDGSTLSGGDTASNNEDQRGLEDAIKDATSEIIDNLISDETISSLVGDVNDSIARGVAYDPTIQPMSAELQARTYDVRAGMLDTLEPLAVQADPSWRFRQENGVLDPTAFVNRDAGETDFWVGLDDDGATGHDLAVSVVLDVSFSMDNWTDALSVGALGIRLACDDLGIPCTLSTFASNGYLWQGADSATELTMVHAHGGTEPLESLEDLVNQRHDKSRHLVVVFTDGEWSGVPSFDQYRTPGTYIIGVGFGYGVAESLEKRRPDALVALNSVDQLPAEVTKALIGYLI